MAPIPKADLLLHGDGLFTLTTHRFTAPPDICTAKHKDLDKHPEQPHSYTNLLFPGKTTMPVSRLPLRLRRTRRGVRTGAERAVPG